MKKIESPLERKKRLERLINRKLGFKAIRNSNQLTYEEKQKLFDKLCWQKVTEKKIEVENEE